MYISDDELRLHFGRFSALIKNYENSPPFISFSEGLPAKLEGYKVALRQVALQSLDPSGWRKEQIGSGRILNDLISSIELSPSNGKPGNNLVEWSNRRGHAGRSHRRILDARSDSSLRSDIESWAFNFYQGNLKDANAFDELCKLIGHRYDLTSYLFFLNDMKKFIPVRPRNFDAVFSIMNIKLRMSQRCSWKNYSEFLAVLGEIQDGLKRLSGTDVRLIDAHSFCWMLHYLPGSAEPSLRETKVSEKDFNRVFSGRERAIDQMVMTTLQTVKQSNGQITKRLAKDKELRMNEKRLENVIRKLVAVQNDRCALTGIAFNYTCEYERACHPSLDRIDSSGHYEEGNLQIVCRFINFWKSDTKNEEFCRLLELVRENSIHSSDLSPQ